MLHSPLLVSVPTTGALCSAQADSRSLVDVELYITTRCLSSSWRHTTTMTTFSIIAAVLLALAAYSAKVCTTHISWNSY
jgi:hypothetical protein